MTPQPIRPAYRFYSFVAGLYISPLQSGLQTAHAVSQMHADLIAQKMVYKIPPITEPRVIYDTWCKRDKTIIICNALNSAGVEEVYEKLKYFVNAGIELPITIFHEDEQSLNNAATAAAVVVPEKYFNAKQYVDFITPSWFDAIFRRKKNESIKGWEYTSESGEVTRYENGSVEAEFIAFLKSFRLV